MRDSTSDLMHLCVVSRLNGRHQSQLCLYLPEEQAVGDVL